MAIGTAVAIGLAIYGASTAIQATGQIKAGNAAKRIGEFNARVAEAQAEDALERGALDEQRFRQGVRVLIGSQRVGFAGQNVDVGSGSAVDVQADAAFLGELDALTIRNNAAREAWGFRVQAENARMGGSAAAMASRWGAASTIVGAGGSLFMAKYGFGGGGSNSLSLASTGVPVRSGVPSGALGTSPFTPYG